MVKVLLYAMLIVSMMLSTNGNMQDTSSNEATVAFVKEDVSLESPFVDYISCQTTGALMDGTYAIVIGKPIGTPRTFVYSIDNAIPPEMKEKAGVNSFGITVTQISFMIDTVLDGDIKEKKIEIIQPGTMDEDPTKFAFEQKKIKGNQRYLVLLTAPDESEGWYGVNHAEQGIYYVDKNNQVYSMSATPICVQADGKKADSYVKELKEAKNKVK